LKPEEKEKLKEKILQRGLDDYVRFNITFDHKGCSADVRLCLAQQIHSHFRILRGSIFKKYAPVDNSWWGWW
jgi:hypothetical protein